MQIDPFNTFAMAGVDAGRFFPLASHCPVCNAHGKLEIRSVHQIVCRSCWFAGDVIQLISACRQETIAQVVAELKVRSLLSISDDEIASYTNFCAQQDSLKHLIMNRASRLKTEVPGSVWGVLSQLNCRTNNHLLTQLLPHITYLNRNTFEEVGITLPKLGKQALCQLGMHTALAVPTWDKVEVVGFYALTKNGAVYIPVTDKACYPVAFGLIPSIQDPLVFVIDDIGTAVRLNFWSLMQTGELTPFVVPFGLQDNVEAYKARRTVFWSPSNDSRWCLRAVNTPGACYFDGQSLEEFNPLSEYPCQGVFNVFKTRVTEVAKPAHEAAALRLVAMRESDARSALMGLTVDAMDRAKILAYVQGEDAKHVATIFDKNIPQETVVWNGETITETTEGWKVGQKIISNVIIKLEQIQPTHEGDAYLSGHFVYERKSYRFKELLSKISKHPNKWLQAAMIKEAGILPYVDHGWRHKLLEVAQQFHIPTSIKSDARYGWNSKLLRLPNFTVDSSGLYSSQSFITGPEILYPALLSQAEWDSFRNLGFCKIVLTLIGNLLRTAQNQPGVGILLTNERHVVHRVASAFGTTCLSDPKLEDIESRTLDPLPTFCEFSERGLFTAFSKAGYKNLMFSVDTHTARLTSVHEDWLHLRVGDSVDYPSLRCVFTLLPELLRSDWVLSAPDFYRKLAERLTALVHTSCEKHRLQLAATDLDMHSSFRLGSTAATRILSLIFYGIERNDIQPLLNDNSVVVRHKDFLRSIAGTAVPIPSINQITSCLQEARFLMQLEEDRWVFSRLMWDMNYSLCSVGH